MFVVTLTFGTNKSRANELMQGHNDWIRRGFEEGVFLLAGSLKPAAGGAIVAHNTSRAELELRIQDDPFVAEEVVRADIIEIAPGRADARLSFLVA
ncbi:YciI family protein [Xanthobacter oligotrophicus]|uniref:YciI family protein n=1 Tax=Xanthobacter oligotrophicus TaxID=2607286 RepID=UPI0011F12F97|nr:YciI family protein [Xanthobacter oligotrophicus]MCG5237241.1 YciI family protein [Xanthobacter oligotrophicus]